MGLVVQRLSEEAVGQHKEVLLSVSFDNSYPTGGEPLGLDKIGMTTVLDMAAHRTQGYPMSYDRVNKKVIVYASAGVEVSNTTDLSALTDVRLRFRGT